MSAHDPAMRPEVAAIDALLPQTQCTRCGYAGCAPYAQAIAEGSAEINQCPPGGQAGIAALAALLGRTPLPLDPAHGAEAPLGVALIDESRCIGCTLCIQACPIDAIVGAPKQLHTVVESLCSGCELCIAPCPVDCISMAPAASPWTRERADAARIRHQRRNTRLERNKRERAARLAPAQSAGASAEDAKRAAIRAALERARARRAASEHSPA